MHIYCHLKPLGPNFQDQTSVNFQSKYKAFLPIKKCMSSKSVCKTAAILFNSQCVNKNSGTWVNSLWPSEQIWWQRSGSTLVQIMACCLMATSHYLNQCWLLLHQALWHSPEINFAASAQATILYKWLWKSYQNYCQISQGLMSSTYLTLKIPQCSIGSPCTPVVVSYHHLSSIWQSQLSTGHRERTGDSSHVPGFIKQII